MKINIFENSEYVEIIEYEPINQAMFISAADLQTLDIPPINWIIPNFLPEGFTLLAGKPKVGKSLLALDAGLSVATGEKFLDLFETNQYSVMYISYEDPIGRLKERINILKENGPKNLVLSWRNFPRLNEGGLKLIEEKIAENSTIKLVIVDPLTLAFKKEKGRPGDIFKEQYELLSQLQKFAISHHLALLFTHHVRKLSSEHPIDSVLGTTGITAAPDSVMILEEKILRIFAKDMESRNYSVELNKDSLRWIIKSGSTVRLTPERQEIVDLFENDYNQEWSSGAIAHMTGKSLGSISNLLKKLAEAEILENVKYGKYKLNKKFHP